MLKNRIRKLENRNRKTKIIFVIDDLTHEQILKSSNPRLSGMVGNDYPLPPGAIPVHIDEDETEIL